MAQSTMAPAALQPTMAPAGVEPAVVQPGRHAAALQFIPRDQLSPDLQMKTRDFRAQPAVDQLIGSAAVGLEKRAQQGGVFAEAAGFNWEQAAPAIASVEGSESRVLAELAPVTASQADYFSAEHLEAVRQNNQNLVVGALVISEPLATNLDPGSYLLEWFSGGDQVCLTDPVTGEQHCGTEAYCEAQPTIENAITTIESGSICFCVKFDSRKCCVCF